MGGARGAYLNSASSQSLVPSFRLSALLPARPPRPRGCPPQAPRAGAAIGVAISLGTTVIFLLITQIMKAVGAGGLIDPTLAAWLPNMVFLLAGLVLLARVRT